MTSVGKFGLRIILGFGFGALSAGIAAAQVPPEMVEINACLCLQHAVSTFSQEMNAKTQALEAVNRQLADLDAQMARERSTVNVNNPDAVAQFKALLERRDAAYRQSGGQIYQEANQATARYNARVNEYNARCANRPFNSAVVAQIQATLQCPPLQ